MACDLFTPHADTSAKKGVREIGKNTVQSVRRKETCLLMTTSFSVAEEEIASHHVDSTNCGQACAKPAWGARGRQFKSARPDQFILFLSLRSKPLEVRAFCVRQRCSCNALRCLSWPLRSLPVFNKTSSKTHQLTKHLVSCADPGHPIRIEGLHWDRREWRGGQESSWRQMSRSEE
jgi:hypothetical protein